MQMESNGVWNSYRLLPPAGMATVSVSLLRVVVSVLRVVLFGVAAHYDPLFFNDCRRELPEESLPVAGGALPVAEKGLPIWRWCHGQREFAVYVTYTVVGVDVQTLTAIGDAVIGLP